MTKYDEAGCESLFSFDETPPATGACDTPKFGVRITRGLIAYWRGEPITSRAMAAECSAAIELWTGEIGEIEEVLQQECKVLDARTPVDVESLAARDGQKLCEEGAILGAGAPCSCEALNDSAYIRVVLENPSHFGSPPREALDALERLTRAAMGRVR